MKLFTIALPLICAAFVGPVAAAEANLRTNTKISDDADAASASLFNRRAQVYEEMKSGGRNQIPCAEQFPNVGLQMLAISAIMSEFIFSILGVNPFVSCHGMTDDDARRLEEEEPTKEATQDWLYSSITMGELKEDLSNIPTLGAFVYPVVVHNPEECVDVQAFAVLINAYFGEMTCNGFYEFLEAGEPFREALAGFGFFDGIGGPGGVLKAGDIGRRFLNSNNKN